MDLQTLLYPHFQNGKAHDILKIIIRESSFDHGKVFFVSAWLLANCDESGGQKIGSSW